MSDSDLQSANRTLQKRYDDIVYLINRIEQLEYAASRSNRPFQEIPRGGFPAAVIDETIWTDIRTNWQCRRNHPLAMTLADAAQRTKHVDDYLVFLDKEHAPAQKAHDASRAHFQRVMNDWH